MQDRSDWKILRELGSGGQSTVHLVQTPDRSLDLESADRVVAHALIGKATAETFVSALASRLRPDRADELGALKVFDKARVAGTAPRLRIEREIAILQEGHPGLPKLLASNAGDLWLITEYFEKGSLDKRPEHFKGDAMRGLSAFQKLLGTVEQLHRSGIVHRDIKPANVFLDSGDRLVLGDFGIAHKDEGVTRLTVTQERVGPWDYMPQWADTGDRLDQVSTSFDVYMLGKLLWCMLSGRLRLPREYHRRPEYDLTVMFPNEPLMEAANRVLDHCLVEHESEAATSAGELARLLRKILEENSSGIRLTRDGTLRLPCLVCGRGNYTEETVGGRVNLDRFNNNNVPQNSIYVRVFSCDVCTHRAFFAPTFPDQAVNRGYTKVR